MSCLLLTRVASGLPQDGKNSDAHGAAPSITGRVSAITGQGETNDLAGVAVVLSSQAPGSILQSTVTDEGGRYQFIQLPVGSYTLEVSQDGFQSWAKIVMVGQGETLIENVYLQINNVTQEIEVHGQASDISAQSVETTSNLSSRELDTLPLAQHKVTEALTLTPGVVRTPEGKLNFDGQSENQGILLLNSTENVDPVTGSFAIPVPIDVVQSMSVHSAPDSAEYGGFSGGMTRIETKPPMDTWSFKVDDVTPSLRGKNGHLRGLGELTPRVLFGGPVIKSKLNFTEELTYELRKEVVRGLPWPLNETKTRGFTSFTEFQAILSPRHLLTFNINIFPLRKQFANITALVPQTASSDYGQHGVSLGISDSYQLSSGGLLYTSLAYTRFDSNAHGQGQADMLVTPEGWGGNFFNSWSRTATEFEARPALQLPVKSWHGRHEVKVGVDVSRRSYEGNSVSHPIELQREDGSVAEEISFQGPGLLRTAATESAEFVEDHWTLNDHLVLDAGARVSSQSVGRAAAFGPHVGIAYSPGKNGKTVFRAAAGLFYSHVPLLATDFVDNPTRVITFFDASGAVTGEPELLQNTYLASDLSSGAQTTQRAPGTSPRTFTWNVEVERELRQDLNLRLSYRDSQTRDLFIVDPVINIAAGTSMLGLTNTGSSHYRQFEAAIHSRPFRRSELSISYVWSRGRGDLNTLSDTFIPFEQPLIRPNASGVLPSDIPNRLVSWGVFELPLKIIFSPVVDLHTGLPFSKVDLLQNYADTPNSLRFPIFFSLDIKVYRDIPLRIPLIRRFGERKLRLGVYSLDLTNHANAHDVYNNLVSPLFGRFAGFQRRIDGLDLDIVE